jgi:tRNA (guanine37-N1)-methyltransferase
MVTLRERLSEKLSEKELDLAKTSFDAVGDIATLEIPTELKKKEKVIAETIMELNHNIRVVAKKAGPTAGVERIRPIKVVLGEKRTETIHNENGCRYKLDINKVYFSPRLGSEHLRVVNQVKPDEVVFDPFAGIGPFAIPIARRGARVVAVDINKNAIAYLNENAKLNKVVGRIEAIAGDARNVLKKAKYKGKAERIIMNLPMHAGEFLDVAFYIAKKGAVVNFYCFLKEDEMFNAGIETIKTAAQKAKRKIKILNTKTCGQLAARIWRCAIDFKVLN